MDDNESTVVASPSPKQLRKRSGGFKSPFTKKKKQEEGSVLEYSKSSKQVKEYTRNIDTMKQAIKILKKYDMELRTMELIDKWRSICDRSMSYILNFTVLKINKLGGYEEYKKREIGMEKAKIEYQMDTSFQEEVDTVLESEEFKSLSVDEQTEYRDQIDGKINEMESWKTSQLQKLDLQLENCQGKEMDMLELSKKLNVDYNLIYPM
ncbi:hypothetical protein KAFR_0H02840 [Kazachstania africana CBS 2517]|uniref:Meiosis protein 5 n=1 Tax=Kazachstania africana (strain ATCC 22294 / BCRC 22015 / CBS 2517 / CECT 1963 / NBRC 1671 / NRRL Y-8276) TaxID=1071382 RepID=H2AZD7_KAZAF|nr:hypothetical protein KAFR_0H02840 [Kazachstania africana CBS 2517]CCF59693.1 hypothetical protein KAFR_0H02840 [Kazachstania africana CBS 2517]